MPPPPHSSIAHDPAFSQPRRPSSPSPASTAIIGLLKRHPLPPPSSLPPLGTYAYGTAGFRYPHAVLPPLMIRVGLFSALRSASLSGEAVGVMITASHNGVNDNGVKLADADGGMLAAEWEGAAVKLGNLRSADGVMDELRNICRDKIGWMGGPFDDEHASNIGSSSRGGRGINGRDVSIRKMVVHVGYDTRPHSPRLASLTIAAARAIGATVINHGLVTTPQLHHIVMHANPHRLPNVIPPRIGETGYVDAVCWGYAGLIGTKERPTGPDDATASRRTLVVDGANGIGHPKLHLIRNKLNDMRKHVPDIVHLIPVNGPNDGPLNEGCGAEFVQKGRLPPLVYGKGGGGKGKPMDNVTYGASLDGDADRVVFHYSTAASAASAEASSMGGDNTKRPANFRLLDGDKIAVLVTQFLQEEINHLTQYLLAANAASEAHSADSFTIRCGVVQTAYANGASTSYLRRTVRTNVVTAKTGVKFVHEAAHTHFDVGVYFEANGHGTVLFGSQFYKLVGYAESYLRGRRGCRANLAWRRLRVLPGLINQAVGDALSDLLLVDAILYLRGWSVRDWDGLYEDMPSRQTKVKVLDRSIITTNESETRSVSPPNLQPALDAAMEALDSAASTSSRRSTKASSTSASPSPSPSPSRCFVRPSGTENAVRVYAEASTQDDADVLASEAAALVHKLCGGKGDPPQIMVLNRL